MSRVSFENYFRWMELVIVVVITLDTTGKLDWNVLFTNPMLRCKKTQIGVNNF